MVSNFNFCTNWVFNRRNYFFPTIAILWPVIKYSFLPFGREIVSTEYLKSFKEKDSEESNFEKASPTVKILANILWVLSFGWILALAHIVAGILNVFSFGL